MVGECVWTRITGTLRLFCSFEEGTSFTEQVREREEDEELCIQPGQLLNIILSRLF